VTWWEGKVTDPFFLYNNGKERKKERKRKYAIKEKRESE
jgi:hypothetical protein